MKSVVGPSTVLYVHSGDDLYGSDMVLLDLVRSLDRERFQPLVVMPADTAHVGKLSAELARHGVPFRHFPFPVLRRRYFTPFGVFRFLLETRKVLSQLRVFAREHNVSLIHTNTLAVPIGALLARRLRVPHVWHVHEILVRPSLVRKLLHRMAGQMSDAVVCISEAVRNHVAEDQPGAKLIVIPNGIRPPSFSSEEPRKIRKALGLPPDSLLVGTIGRISPWKGQVILSRSATIVKKSGRQAHFVVIGGVFDGDMRPLETLRQTIEADQLQQDFTILDFRPDARELLPSFDIFVLPSILPEPFGLVVTEAMAAGRPVIATNQGGPREIVVHGETGLLVPANDPQAMADAIALLLDNPELRQKFGSAGRLRMMERFSLESFVNSLSNTYGTLLAQREVLT